MKIITSQAQLFDYTDKVIKIYLVTILKKYKKLQNDLTLLKFDEINNSSVIEMINKTYYELDIECKKAMRLIAMPSYKQVHDDKGELKDSWLEEYYKTPNPVTKYEYQAEVDRKRARTLESIIAILLTANPKTTIPKEITTARNLWVKQFEQNADNLTTLATLQAYEDYGIVAMQWNTQEDERVCETCGPLDGQIFTIEKIKEMMPAHYGCRCFATPVIDTRK